MGVKVGTIWANCSTTLSSLCLPSAWDAKAAQHNDEGVVQQLAKMIPTFTPTRQNLKL